MPLTRGRMLEVTAGSEAPDADDGRHWSEGFGDLYETLEGIGESAVWEPLSHTLHTQQGGWAVTATVDVTFGSEIGDDDIALIHHVARAALAARPSPTAPAPSQRSFGRLRRGRRP
ncbi:MAG: hypothetical protein ACR2LQ_05840 [Acidimicrobiales bacterium]